MYQKTTDEMCKIKHGGNHSCMISELSIDFNI